MYKTYPLLIVQKCCVTRMLCVLTSILLLESCSTYHARPPFYIIDHGKIYQDTLIIPEDYYRKQNERIEVLHSENVIEVCEAVKKKYFSRSNRSKWCDETYTIELINDSVWHVYKGFIPKPRKAVVAGGGLHVYLRKSNGEVIAVKGNK